MKLIVTLYLLCFLVYSEGCFKCFLKRVEKIIERMEPKYQPNKPNQCPKTESCCDDVRRITSKVDLVIQNQIGMSEKLQQLASMVENVQSSTRVIYESSTSVHQLMESRNTEIVKQITSVCNRPVVQPVPNVVPIVPCRRCQQNGGPAFPINRLPIGASRTLEKK
uniref:Uncharacterized protein n=1 Tax=Lygus hesperus TaxID=30085 RepID=A0A0K8SYP0_LYGHE